jgi:hypothetical protein
MALLRAEPGGDYTTNLNLMVDGTNGVIVSAAQFYAGSAPAIHMQYNGRYVYFNIASTNIAICQCLFKVSALTAIPIIQFREGTTVHADLRITLAGQLQITRNGVVLGTSEQTIAPLQEVFIGFKARIDNSLGWAVATINGVECLNLNNINTRNAATGICNNVLLQGTEYDPKFRDIIIMDAVDGTTLTPPQNAAFNDLLGPVRLSCKFPNGVGAYTQGTVTGAATVSEAVDETNTDSDTSFVALAATEKFTNVLQDMTQLGTNVHGVVLFDASRVDDASTVTQRQIAKLGASESQLTARNLGASYTFDRQVLAKPGGGAWTVSDVNALEIGVERTA